MIESQRARAAALERELAARRDLHDQARREADEARDETRAVRRELGKNLIDC
jgi:hypothetical protein